MALIVEDGSGVAGATSYIDVATARAFVALRGLTLPASDSAVEVLLIRAMDYIEQHGQQFQGQKTQQNQPLQWPRYGVVIDHYDLPSDTIPVVLRQAQAHLAHDAVTHDLIPTVASARDVISEKVDVIEVRYAPGGSMRPVLAMADSLLAPLLRVANGLRSERI